MVSSNALRRVPLALLAGWVIAASPAAAQQARVLQAGQTMVDEAMPGVVRGVVVHGDDDEPVAGLVVVLRRPKDATTRVYPEPWVADPGGGGPIARVETDDRGRFSFAGLAPSRYSVAPRRTGLGGGTAHVVVTHEEPTVAVTLRVTLGGVIRGVVVGVDGAPLDRTSVLVSGLDLGDGLNRLDSSRPDRVRTDSEGRFVLLGAPRGTVYLKAARWEWGWSEPIALEMRDVREVRDVRLLLEEEPGALAFDGPAGIGVGLNFTPAGPAIKRIYEGSPAQRGGLQPLDLIKEVGGRDTRFMTPEEFRARCRGPVGSTVDLVIVRPDGVSRAVSLVRSGDPWKDRAP